MAEVTVANEVAGFRVRLWRGESMCLLGFDVDDPEPDFVGFAVQYREPGQTVFKNLRNRLAFDAKDYVDGNRNFETTKAPLQTFRWVHFPWEPRAGTYTYRVTKMHMPSDGLLRKGLMIELPIDLNPVTIDNFVDIGFARNFASSQAFGSKCKDLGINDPNEILPNKPEEGLGFAEQRSKIAANPKGDIYKWLGFEAYRLLFGFLDWAIADTSVTVDAMAYDLNEAEIVARLEQLGPRLRMIIDDSKGHGGRVTAESRAARLLRKSTGSQDAIHRGHFRNLQHNKILIAKRNGVPIRVLGGSTNFSYRGLYIQANNMYVFNDGGIAAKFSEMFDLAFDSMDDFTGEELSKKWHEEDPAGQKPVRLCFSPHTHPDLALSPVGGAIDQATSSVFYSFAFMSQTKTGDVREALDRLIPKPLFSYGVVNTRGGMKIQKPSGETGLVDFAYLADHAPEPFKSEWSGGKGINIHHKFVVVDFDKPGAKVFTGSSNFSPSGENNNGDHMVVIEDQRIATAYAIEALRVFDHLNFRNRMKDAVDPKKPIDPLVLLKPVAFAPKMQKEPWFAKYYEPGSQRERDRLTFARP
ncbi:MAG: phospholipase D-like domain-containing protein [Mycobacterium kyogaense]|uniref:phospholipase D-like domain-containing protein n=1 Tax=Mycobacterium kyogaense TaxID=2212479 RepID=UPI002FFB00C2